MARKAATSKPTPRRRKKQAPADLAVPKREAEWPPYLSDDLCKSLFENVENGDTVKRAALKLGLVPADIYRYVHRYPKFATRMGEAEFIGHQMVADDLVDISDTAFDRDSAAAAKERREARLEYLRIKDPETYRISPFKPKDGSNPLAAVIGVVVVPAKSSAAGRPPERPAIDGSAVEIQRTEPPALNGNKKFVVRAPNGSNGANGHGHL